MKPWGKMSIPKSEKKSKDVFVLDVAETTERTAERCAMPIKDRIFNVRVNMAFIFHFHCFGKILRITKCTL